MANISQIKIGSTTYNIKDANASTTDTKVSQVATTTSAEYPLLMKYTNNTTAETTSVRYGSGSSAQMTANPSTGRVSAISYQIANKVTLNYNATTEALDFIFL